MKEELYLMLDGDLPDEGVAELLHRLSVDPEKRLLFLQELRLQHALAYNGAEQSMSTVETTEMRDRIASAIGASGGSAPRGRFRGKALGTLAVGLLIGSGLGFATDRWVGAAESPPAPLQSMQPAPAPISAPSLPTIQAPVDTAVPGTASAAQADTAGAAIASAPAKSTRKAKRSKVSTPQFGNDVTGAPEARARARKAHGHRATPE